MRYFVSIIWLAMSALGCWPNASGWSTLGSILMYSCKKKSLQLLERLFMSTVECYHSLIGFAFADHWLNATICSKTRASCWKQSQQTCCAFNKSEATLPHARSPALGIDFMFSRAWKCRRKGYCFCSCFFFPRHIPLSGSGFRVWTEPKQDKIMLLSRFYVDGRSPNIIFSRTLCVVDLVSVLCQS